MNEKYNLTWEEAKTAMARGAIVENANCHKFEYRDGKYINIDDGWIVTGRVYYSIRESKWRIKEVRGCNYYHSV